MIMTGVSNDKNASLSDLNCSRLLALGNVIYPRFLQIK
ncbi:Uncharacterised protein [Vibrio cholerae]|uniref:Uncharacterized protein n=1 Tax=Vibrio cholerae TaxID=666 RepID=A0A655R817_VIBCL|nr:Uncharacterised protein [Vibrio cholerae]CSB51673.1 Uncharacterised protein [Vibrio cholerae]